MCETTILKDFIAKSEKIAVLTGAGISTESGIADFRSENGIFKTIKKYGYTPEELLSHSFFCTETELFFKYYRENFIVTDANPNAAHNALVKLEQAGKLSAVITQNVDGLHTRAGNKNVYELHGSIYRNFCMKCHKFHSVEFVRDSNGVPLCDCGGTVKPDVVLYEESLDENAINGAADAVMQADMLIVCGSSLAVYPAAGLVPLYRGKRLVIINKTPTPYDTAANLVIHDSLGKVLSEAVSDI